LLQVYTKYNNSVDSFTIEWGYGFDKNMNLSG